MVWLSSNSCPPEIAAILKYKEPTLDEALPRIKAIADVVLSNPVRLKMGSWHGYSNSDLWDCETTHCLAGFAVALGGAEALAIEAEFSTAFAGRVLLGAEAASLFHADSETVLYWLRTKTEVV
jgi:hypothetical protein